MGEFKVEVTQSLERGWCVQSRQYLRKGACECPTIVRREVAACSIVNVVPGTNG